MWNTFLFRETSGQLCRGIFITRYEFMFVITIDESSFHVNPNGFVPFIKALNCIKVDLLQKSMGKPESPNPQICSSLRRWS